MDGKRCREGFPGSCSPLWTICVRCSHPSRTRCCDHQERNRQTIWCRYVRSTAPRPSRMSLHPRCRSFDWTIQRQSACHRGRARDIPQDQEADVKWLLTAAESSSPRSGLSSQEIPTQYEDHPGRKGQSIQHLYGVLRGSPQPVPTRHPRPAPCDPRSLMQCVCCRKRRRHTKREINVRG